MKTIFGTIILTFLKFLAQLQLMKVHPIVVGVTGSAGKSSTVRAIALALAAKHKVKVGQKGNSQTGIPFEILDIPIQDYRGVEWLIVCVKAVFQLVGNWKKYDVLILEMGIDSDKHPNNMEYLLSIVEPDIGVLLNVNPVHSANYRPSDDILLSIANEKGKLLRAVPPSGLAILSTDQSQTKQLIPKIKSRVQTFSVKNADADISLSDYKVSMKGTTYTFVFKKNKYTLFFPNKLFFKEAFGGFASALIIADHLQVPISDAIENLVSQYELPPGRMSILEGIKNTTIIDSTYNSSPGSTFPALTMLRDLSGKKGVILGDMRELGPETKKSHEELAEYAKNVADWIVLVGPLTQQYTYPELLKLKFPEKKVISVQTAYQALPIIQKMIDEKDLLFIKGSQNTILLEIIVKELMKYPEKAEVLLCRQTPYWEEKREELKTI